MKVLGKNRRAFYEYEIIERYECGIVLRGTEVKSLKAGTFNFADCYARITHNECWLVGFHISAYDHGNIHNHEPVQKRKLLLHREEIKKLIRKTEGKGFTLIPVALLRKDGLIKVEIALCRGKKIHDKRKSIKERDVKRQIDRDLKSSHRS
ncbi:MAG: SsrA-binding protein SmpB [Salinispira sp.]